MSIWNYASEKNVDTNLALLHLEGKMLLSRKVQTGTKPAVKSDTSLV